VETDTSTLLNTCLIIFFFIVINRDLRDILQHQVDQVGTGIADILLCLETLVFFDLFDFRQSCPKLDTL